MNEKITNGRSFLKNTNWTEIDFSQTDQKKGLKAPGLQKHYDEKIELVDLLEPKDLADIKYDLLSAMTERKSHRNFIEKPLSIKELSFLIWTTAGIKKIVSETTALRMVPSAGSRHPFETYLYVRNVEGVNEGIYRYLPLDHKLILEISGKDLSEKISSACVGQTFVGNSAVTFIWVCLPYRTEWRYREGSHKVIAIDVGHVCQNLYLACSAIESGTCAIGAYDQKKIDDLLSLDGEDEFVIYMAPVGKVSDAK